MRENPALYAVAKRITLEAGYSWTDPRTGETFRPPARKPRKNKTSPAHTTNRISSGMPTDVSNIKIERNIPITPLPPRRGGSGLAHIVRQLKIGDSFVTPELHRNAAFVAARRVGMKLLSRSAGNGHYRIWRVRAPLKRK